MVINSSYHDCGGGDMNLCIGLNCTEIYTYIHTRACTDWTSHVPMSMFWCRYRVTAIKDVDIEGDGWGEHSLLHVPVAFNEAIIIISSRVKVKKNKIPSSFLAYPYMEPSKQPEQHSSLYEAAIVPKLLILAAAWRLEPMSTNSPSNSPSQLLYGKTTKTQTY